MSTSLAAGRNRRVTATALIILVVLIALGAVAGYRFGLFGSSTNSAQPQIVNYSFSASSGNLVLGLSKSEDHSVSVKSASVNVGGTIYADTMGVYSGAGNATIQPGGPMVPVATATNNTVTFTGSCSSGASCADWTSASGAEAIFQPGVTYAFILTLSNGKTSTITVVAS